MDRAAPTQSALELAFRSSGIPLSRQRLLVVRLLAEASDHPTAASLHARARKIDPGVGRTAVNRALAALVDAGLANVIESGRGQYRYEDATLGSHGHLIDCESGDLINVSTMELDEAMARIAKDLGYRLTDYRLLLRGQRPSSEASSAITSRGSRRQRQIKPERAQV